MVVQLDTSGTAAHDLAMAENPYAMPLAEFETRVRVPVAKQVAVQPVQTATTDLDWCAGDLPAGDGGDAGGCD
jgi:hypothetical protein